MKKRSAVLHGAILFIVITWVVGLCILCAQNANAQYPHGIPVGRSIQSAIAYTDSAATVADGSVTSPKLTQSGTLTASMDQLFIAPDTLAFSLDWAGFQLWDATCVADPCSMWVACPVIKDGDDSTTVAVWPVSYGLQGKQFGPAQGYSVIRIGRFFGPTASPYGEGGFYATRKTYSTDAPGFHYFVVRLRAAP